MALVGADFLGEKHQKIRLSSTLGEAFNVVCERFFGRNRQDMVREWKIDPKTVANIKDGKAGSAVITKALMARKATHDDAWDFADAILEQVLGETRSEYEERKLRQFIENTNNAVSLHEERKARRKALAERAAVLDDSLARISADTNRTRTRRRG